VVFSAAFGCSGSEHHQFADICK